LHYRLEHRIERLSDKLSECSGRPTRFMRDAELISLLLAAPRAAVRLRRVTEADDDGNEPDRDQRLAGLRLAQRLAEPGRTVLLFDEAEDLFLGRHMLCDEPRMSSRVFVHWLLERMAMPVIWTANDIGVLGPAVLRHMTMCLELRVPNLAARTVLWRRLGEAHGVALCEADAVRLARLVPAAPAVAATALKARGSRAAARRRRGSSSRVSRGLCAAGPYRRRSLNATPPTILPW
jgi:hypothetical protein